MSTQGNGGKYPRPQVTAHLLMEEPANNVHTNLRWLKCAVNTMESMALMSDYHGNTALGVHKHMKSSKRKVGGRYPKRRGSDFERELVNQAEACGLQAQRAWGSDGRSLGLASDVDCEICGRRPDSYKMQAKRRKGISQDLIPSDSVDCVAVRQDRGETLIVLRYADWLELIS